MTFGVGDGGRIQDKEQIVQIMNLFKSARCNELDTARMYCDGNTEEVLGEMDVEKDWIVATKAFPFKAGMLAPDLMIEQFYTSLAAMKVYHVDIFYLHAPDKTVQIEETLKGVHTLHKQGKFTEFGLSNYSAWSVADIWYH
jgi:aflatoxin B1 aldehyde reductase